MKLTNVNNIPEAFVRAIEQQDKNYLGGYTQKADISVTALLQPPQIRHLTKTLQDEGIELVEDVSDRIWALLGQLMHSILEDAGNLLTEHRMYTKVEGWTVSGQLDAYDPATGTLQDYKLCSVWEHIGGMRPDREQQLNMLAYMLRLENRYVKKIQIVSVYRDWSKNQAARDANYPQQQVAVHEMNLWSDEDVLTFMTERVRLHQEASTYRCTEEDRWARPTKYAIMHPKKKRAIKLHDDPDLADQHAYELGPPHYVEVRPGESVRCQSYCPVAEYCPQYREMQ